MQRLFILSVVASVVASLCATAVSPAQARRRTKRASPWADVRAPAEGPARAIGSYTAGCVQGAQALPLDGPGFQVAKPSRDRHYGHPLLAAFVRSLGKQVSDAGLGVLLIGDLGQPRGGPVPTDHSSHQSGLDADIWFWAPRSASERVLPVRTRERLKPRSVVSVRRGERTRHWSPRVARVLELAASDEHVSRIFINPLIKRELCRRAQGDRSWLRKLRPWYGHSAHFHVRLACPGDSPGCKPQAALPPGDGCDELPRWFDAGERAERKAEFRRYQKTVRHMPELPAACAALLE